MMEDFEAFMDRFIKRGYRRLKKGRRQTEERLRKKWGERGKEVIARFINYLEGRT